MVKNKFIRIIGVLFILLAGFYPSLASAQSSATLDRILAQIESLYPPVEGYVIAVEGTGLTLDLKQGMPVKKGDRLKLIRYGRELFHPVTKKKVGRKETDLGEVEILEIRKNFSRARATDPTVLAKEGDGVRSPFQKLTFLVAPPEIASKNKIDANRLRLNLEKKLNQHPRFEVPAFDLGLWMVDEKLNTTSALKSQNLERLNRKVKADLILIPKVSKIEGRMALSYKLVSAVDGALQKQAKVMSDDLPESDSRRERDRGPQQSFKTKKSPFKFIDKQEFLGIVDFDIGDLNGDGEDEFVLIDAYRVLIFKYENGKLRKTGQFSTSMTSNKFLAVDVGDINGNGRDEIFVTNQVGDRLESFAIEREPKTKGFNYVWKNANLYFRIIRPFGSKPILHSQAQGFQDPLQGPIRRVGYRKGRYIEATKLNTPEIYGTHFILYGLTQVDLNGDKIKETIVLDNKYHLRVYSQNGKLQVKSDDYYGSDPRIIDVGVREDIGGIVQQGQPVRFRGRLQFVKNGDRKFLVLPLNHTVGGGFIDKLVIVDNSSLAVLGVTREGFEKVYESNPLKGYLGTFRVVPRKDNSGARVYILRLEQDSLGGTTRMSTFSSYDWPAN